MINLSIKLRNCLFWLDYLMVVFSPKIYSDNLLQLQCKILKNTKFNYQLSNKITLILVFYLQEHNEIKWLFAPWYTRLCNWLSLIWYQCYPNLSISMLPEKLTKQASMVLLEGWSWENGLHTSPYSWMHILYVLSKLWIF